MAIFFGFISILTLTCSIPAVILSCMVREFLYQVYGFSVFFTYLLRWSTYTLDQNASILKALLPLATCTLYSPALILNPDPSLFLSAGCIACRIGRKVPVMQYIQHCRKGGVWVQDYPSHHSSLLKYATTHV